MKILVISARLPENHQKGDQVLSFNRISYLAKNHKVKLICFGDDNENHAPKEILESMGVEVVIVKWKKIIAVKSILRSLIGFNLPFQCALFDSPDFRKALKLEISNFNPDVLYAVTVRVMSNFDSKTIPVFIDLIDSMGLNFYRRINMSGGLKRLLFKIEYNLVRKYEKLMADFSAHSFVVSSIDKQFIGSDNISVIPLGVDVNHFFKRELNHNEPVLIFTGNMSYQPNVDAVMWFYKNCWDNLKSYFPNCRFVIAGNNPSSEVLALKTDESVSVTGRVESLAVELSLAQVSIAPMQSGSGMQFKILEAMACGIPVVTTTLGLGDVHADVDRDLLVADTPDLFVAKVASLLSSQSLRMKIGNAGWEFVNKFHTWNTSNASFEKIILDSINN